MGSNNYIYEMPENFLEHVVQLLQQKNKSLADAFKNCSYDYEDTGWANYKDFKGGVNTWSKKAIILTIKGREQHINLLERSKPFVQSTISNALQTNTTGFLLININYLKIDESTSYIEIEDSLEKKFIEISTRQAPFNRMSLDEKIAELNNIIENLLKKDGKFVELPYEEISYDFIGNDTIKKYRSQTQCFRHSSEKAISERKAFTEDQKLFLANYGLIIAEVIHLLVNKENI